MLNNKRSSESQLKLNMMTTSKFIKIFFLIILGITLESCGIAPRTLGTYIEDHAIVSHANKITNNGDANEQKYSVQAHAYNEILLLTGEVAREKTRLDILENMTKIPKVRQIHNQIHIGDSISYLTKINDHFVRTKIKSKLAFSGIIKSREVRIVCRNGTVYLMGIISPQKAKKLTKVVRETRGVKKVIDLFEAKG